MKRTYDFTVYGLPKPKGRPRMTRSGHIYTPAQTKKYETLIKKEFLKHTKAYKDGFTPIENAVSIRLAFFFPIPKSYTKKKRLEIEMSDYIYTKTPDIDNLMKSVLDGLNKVAFVDDKQVWSLSARKYYTTKEPRVEIHIKEE